MILVVLVMMSIITISSLPYCGGMCTVATFFKNGPFGI